MRLHQLTEADKSLLRKTPASAIRGPVHVFDQQISSISVKFSQPVDHWDGYFKFLNCPNITDLVGSPRVVHGVFGVQNCGLKSFKGAPEYAEGFSVRSNKLKDFDGLNITVASAEADLSFNAFESLQNIHKHIKCDGDLDVSNNPVKSHVLGLFLTGAKEVYFDAEDDLATRIITKWLAKGLTKENMVSCQEDLIEHNLEAYAQL
jgi:hypothetical protein